MAGLCDTNVCDLSLIGDGTCNSECNNANCAFDGGDCCLEVVAACSIFLGDGVCDTNCNIPECLFDRGDCDGLDVEGNGNLQNNTCEELGCVLNFQGDGTCQDICNNEKCNFDSPDCNSINCAANNCTASFIGNGFCDPECNINFCSFDNGDCVNNNCTCATVQIGDGVCNNECDISACNFDDGDCETDPFSQELLIALGGAAIGMILLVLVTVYLSTRSKKPKTRKASLPNPGRRIEENDNLGTSSWNEDELRF